MAFWTAAHAVAAALKASGVDLTLKTLNDQHIASVLNLVDGNLVVAADLLGVNRRSLQRRARRSARRRRAVRR